MRKYKIHVSRNEKIFITVTLALFVAFIIWFYVGKERSILPMLMQLPLWIIVFLIQIKEVRLHDNNVLELRSYMQNKLQKPISIQQVTSYKQDTKNKNILTIVYFRDQLRGSWTLRLSEKDIDDLVSELVRRNPAIVKE